MKEKLGTSCRALLFHRCTSTDAEGDRVQGQTHCSAEAVNKLGIKQDPGSIADRFINDGFVEAFYHEEDQRRSARRTVRAHKKAGNNQLVK
jgi:hypothetical protein